MTARRRMAFVTIGQSPRLDMVPEMYADLPRVDVIERGALDGLSEAEIAALAPVDGAKSLVTRLVDGREVVLDHARTEARLAAVLEELDGEDMDAVVVLCTGTEVPPLKNSLVIEAQAVVDSLVAALARGVHRLGVIVPLERQVGHTRLPGVTAEIVTSHASPYSGDRLAEAARELSGSDLIVMHCMGYSEAMRARVARHSRAPVLLSRRMVAGAIRQLL
jgi:protein AroM